MAKTEIKNIIEEVFNTHDNLDGFVFYDGNSRVELISGEGDRGYILFIGDPLDDDGSGKQRLFTFNRYTQAIGRCGCEIIQTIVYGKNSFGVSGIYWKNKQMEEAA